VKLIEFVLVGLTGGIADTPPAERALAGIEQPSAVLFEQASRRANYAQALAEHALAVAPGCR
jgi:hypothetical protein